MKNYKRIYELEIEAKEKFGDKAAHMIAEDLKIDKWDSRTLKGCSPFGIDHNPSFVWNPKDNCFKDFSSGKNYGIIDHLMSFYHLSRLGAIRKLCELAGINPDVQVFYDKNRYKREKLAVDEKPNDRKIVEAYAAKRGISVETLDFGNVKQGLNGECAFQIFDEDGRLISTKYRVSRSPKNGEYKWRWQEGITNHDILYGINRVHSSEPLLIVEGMCFPYDAEVLTPNGWMKLGMYDGSDILQVNEDLSCEFVTPEAYVVNDYHGEMYRVERGGNYLSETTKEHKIVYLTHKGKITKCSVCDMPKSIEGRIPTAVTYNLGKGINLSDYELRLFVAYSADGSSYKNKPDRIRFSFSKKGKFDRLIKILDSLGISYTFSIKESDKYLSRHLYYIGFTDDKKYLKKKFDMSWIKNLSSHQIDIILNEVIFWDGYKFKNRNMGEFYTTIKSNADFIQTLCHLSGFMSTIKKREYVNNNTVYCVSMLYSKSSISWQQMDKHTKIYDYNGKVYCVKVNSGMILVRQEDKITVSSNCDRLACIEAGFKNVVSIPNGAESTKWIDYSYDFLQNCEDIILWFDNDEAGLEGRRKVAERLGEYRIKLVNPGEEVEDKIEEWYSKYKAGQGIRKSDANNVLVCCGKEEVLRLIREATIIENPKIRKIMEFQELQADDIPHSSTGIVEMDRIFGGVYENSLTIITGVAGDGKSNFINTMYIISPLENGESVFLYTGELPNRIVLGNVLPTFASRRHIIRYENPGRPDGYKVSIQASKAIHDFYMDKFYVYDEGKDLGTTSVQLFDNMVYAYKRHGCTNFIVDNLLSLDCSKEQGESYMEQEASFVKKLKVLANTYPIKICIVIHSRKIQPGTKNIGADDIYGSSTHIKVCDRAYSVKRFDEPDKDGNTTEVRCIKDRLKGLKGKLLRLKFDIPSKRLYTLSDERDRKLTWEKDFFDGYPDILKPRLICNIPEYQDEYCELF